MKSPFLHYGLWYGLLGASVCFGCPSKKSSIPAAATTAINKVAKAAANNDYATLKTLMEPTILVEAGAEPVTADTAIAMWKSGNPPLTEVTKAIQAGCELSNDAPQEVTCPTLKTVTAADPDVGVYIISLRPGKSGCWLMSTATYAD